MRLTDRRLLLGGAVITTAVAASALQAGGVSADLAPSKDMSVELMHAPLGIIAPGDGAPLRFLAVCNAGQTTEAPLDASGAASGCAGATFTLTVRTSAGAEYVLPTKYDAGDSSYTATLQAPTAGTVSYSAGLSWRDLRAVTNADVLVSDVVPVRGLEAVLRRKNPGSVDLTVAWKQSTLRPAYGGGTAIGPTGWATSTAGGHWLVDPSSDELVDVDTSGNVRSRRPAHVASAAITGLVLHAPPGQARRALIAAQDESGSTLRSVNLETGQAETVMTLPAGRRAGGLLSAGGGLFELVTYPGPKSQAVRLAGDKIMLGEERVDRLLTAGDGARLRVSVTDESAKYCVTEQAQPRCYSLSSASLGGLIPAELAFAGVMDDGTVVLVQKVFNDDSDFYLVLKESGSQMRVVDAVPSVPDFELPVTARFTLSPDGMRLLQLRPTRDALTVSSINAEVNR